MTSVGLTAVNANCIGEPLPPTTRAVTPAGSPALSAVSRAAARCLPDQSAGVTLTVLQAPLFRRTRKSSVPTVALWSCVAAGIVDTIGRFAKSTL